MTPLNNSEEQTVVPKYGFQIENLQLRPQTPMAKKQVSNAPIGKVDGMISRTPSPTLSNVSENDYTDDSEFFWQTPEEQQEYFDSYGKDENDVSETVSNVSEQEYSDMYSDEELLANENSDSDAYDDESCMFHDRLFGQPITVNLCPTIKAHIVREDADGRKI